MTKIALTADSTVDLSPELYRDNQVRVMPLQINFGERSLPDDGSSVTPSDIYRYVEESGSLPFTSAVSIGSYADAFGELTAQGYEVVHINISSDFSSAYQNACIAAEDYPGVYVVDSRNLSTGSGHLVLEAARMIREGKLSAQEIAEELKRLARRVDASFVLADLTYLHKGGRCSAVAKLGANLLKLKPCIQVRDGKMGVAKKYRGEYKACVEQYVRDRLSDTASLDPRRIFITHTECPQEVLDLAIQTVKECFHFDEVLVTMAGCTVTTHCGKNTLGVLFFRNRDL